MALPTLNLWEIALCGTQVCLCGLILLFLVRNRNRYKQVFRKAPTDENTWNFNAEFIVEAVRQQTEMAFNHILDAINNERQTLEAYFELRQIQGMPAPFKSISTDRNNKVCAPGATELDAADTIHNEIENLADQGMNLKDISEKLHVPPGEVDLVLKLRRLSAESSKKKASNSSP